VLDFRQVDAPEPPPPANEVSFELSSVPSESSEPASNPEAAVRTDDRYFDLIPQQGPSTTAPTEPTRPSERVEAPSTESAVAAGTGFELAESATPGAEESGFDLAGLTETPLISNATPERGRSFVEEEPLGDVFSPDQTASSPSHETSFAIAEEPVTVDVRPPVSESFSMVLPPSQEGGYSGVWPQLDSDQSVGSQTPRTDSESIGGSSINAAYAPLPTDSGSNISSERSFAISETGTVEKPFDPMELRADEPTEASPAMQFHTDFRTEPATEPFTSSLLWSEHTEGPAPTSDGVAVDEPLGQVLATVAEETAADSAKQWAGAGRSAFDLAGTDVLEAPVAGPSTGPESAESHLGTVDTSTIANQPDTVIGPSVTDLSPAAIDEIVRRVVREMSDAVVRELAWEILPDCVERVVEKLSRESLAKKL
jgi:hypothetical protein